MDLNLWTSGIGFDRSTNRVTNRLWQGLHRIIETKDIGGAQLVASTKYLQTNSLQIGRLRYEMDKIGLEKLTLIGRSYSPKVNRF